MTLTRAQVMLAEKLADQNGLSYNLMMQNAGTMAYKYIQNKLNAKDKKCVILAGNGNNSGDAFVIARLLSNEKADVTLIMCMSVPLTPLAIENFESLRNHSITIIDIKENLPLSLQKISEAELIIDGIFGIAFHGELPSEVAVIVTASNNTTAQKVALDVPSGVVCDSGEISNVCFDADYTLSFGAYKPAHFISPSLEKCGIVEVLDIGIPGNIIFAVTNHVTRLDKKLIEEILPKRLPTANKGDFGKLLNIAGSETMSGAAMMSTLAAMRVGAGIVRLATTDKVAFMVAPHLMEAMTIPLKSSPDGSIAAFSISQIDKLLKKSTACLVGCGLCVTASTKQIVEYIIKNAECSVILDADGLNCILGNVSLLKKAKNPVIITPHIGEMARLVSMSIQDVIDNARDIARVFAKENNCIVVLKSHKTLIATQTGELFENRNGNAGLAKGGSGDVLAGMIAGFAAQGFSKRNAALCGVYLHGDCADSLSSNMSLYSMLARDIIDEIPNAMKRINT